MIKRENEKYYITGEDLRLMFLEACEYFEQYKEAINRLNVFPVPDGDTGTNMSLTIQAAAKELQNMSFSSVGEVTEAAARSSLMGARGNSGVIFSQLLRGVARGLSGKKEAGPSELGKAFQYGIVCSYNAVSNPVEGTILTVARDIARGSREAVQSSPDFLTLLEVALNSGKKSIERTPELLPVLKEAGVVDAAGLGLVVFLEGCLQGIMKRAEDSEQHTPESKTYVHLEQLGFMQREKKGGVTDIFEEYNPSFPYCTELVIKGSNLSLGEVRKKLEDKGDSLLVAGEEGIARVHIHTADPGEVLQICLLQGSIHEIKIDNMMDQFQETQWSSSTTKKNGAELNYAPGNFPKEDSYTDETLLSQVGVVAISAGEGLSAIFKNLGADSIISGGQGMSPSVQEIVTAIENVEAQKVIVLPNNSNIHLAAEQAAYIVEKEVAVVDSRSIPQGIAALLAVNKKHSLRDNTLEMNRRAQEIKTGEITYAMRDTYVNDLLVEKDCIIGLAEGKLLVSGSTVNKTALQLIHTMLSTEDEIVSLFYGQEVSEEQAQELVSQLEEECGDIEVELQYGGQPLYYYILSIE